MGLYLSKSCHLLSLEESRIKPLGSHICIFLKLIELIKREWITVEVRFLMFFIYIHLDLDQYYLTELSVMMEMLFICTVQCGSY